MGREESLRDRSKCAFRQRACSVVDTWFFVLSTSYLVLSKCLINEHIEQCRKHQAPSTKYKEQSSKNQQRSRDATPSTRHAFAVIAPRLRSSSPCASRLDRQSPGELCFQRIPQNDEPRV